MQPAIFDSGDRTSTMPKAHQESSFAFFNRIQGDFWAAVRIRMQMWANEVPEEDYADFRGRLRSGDDYQFNSVYLELYLHESLRRAGYAITVHPSTPSGRKPDFYASRADGSFYLEAIAPAPSPAAKAKAARLARLYDVIDKTGDPGWGLWLENIEAADTTPSGAKLRSAIRAWLRTLDTAQHTDIRERPRLEWEGNGWEIALTAFPRNAEGRRSKIERSIGVYPAIGGFIDDSSPIKQALGRKDQAYGDLQKPLMIAVGVYQFDRDRWGTANALWGHEAFELLTNDPTAPGRPVRQPDGYFGTPDAWRHTNISGVLVVNQLQPTHFSSADVSLWLHPAPTAPLPASIGWPVDLVTLTTDGITTHQPSVSPSQFFELPDVWPPGEAFPEDIAATQSEGGPSS